MHLQLLPELTQDLFRILQTEVFRQKILNKEEDLSDLNNLRSMSYNFASFYKIHTLPIELYARLEFYAAWTGISRISRRVLE
jgi:hypothetical protein